MWSEHYEQAVALLVASRHFECLGVALWRGITKDVNGIAYLVARAIGRRGIKGRYPLAKAVKSSMVRIGMLFREALDRISADMKV